MAADTNLLAVFLNSRADFEKFESSIPEHLLENETKSIIADMREWYKNNHDADSVDIGPFWEWMKLTRHSGESQERLDILKAFLQRAWNARGHGNAVEILRALTLRNHAGRLAEKCDRFAAGDTSFDLFMEALDDIESAQRDAGLHNDHEYEITDSFESIVSDVTDLSHGLSWRSPQLNQALGPIRKGNFIVLAAFVDSGKSTLLTSEVTYMAQQLKGDESVLFLNNEESGKVVWLRIVMATLGLTVDEVKKDPRGAWEAYLAAMGGFRDRIVLVDSARISTGIIRRKLRQYNVKLIAADQLYKIKGFKRYGEDKLGQLQDVFEYGRGLAKEHAPVIAVHQARGDANGERFIEMHQLAGSQQAIQGEADAIITVGRDLKMPTARFIYVPKNKLPTPGDPAMRNGQFEVFPDFSRARFV